MTAIASIDHVGITVPDLDEAIDFFVDAFGCEVVFRAGPYENVGYVWPGESEPEVVTVRLAVLTHGGAHNLEFLEYRPAGERHEWKPGRPSQPGGFHLAFWVEDARAALECLRAIDGVQVMGEVEAEQGGPIDGLDWVYLLTPWGMAIELLNWEPGRLPYEQQTSARMIPPAHLR